MIDIETEIKNGHITCEFFNGIISKDVWDSTNNYPEDLHYEFLQLREALYLHLTSQYTKDSKKHYKFHPDFLAKFSQNLINFKKITPSFIKSKGIKTHIGYLWSITMIRAFFQKYPIAADSKFPYFRTLNYYCISGTFKEYNISSWKDLYKNALVDIPFERANRLFVTTEIGLVRAKDFLRSFYDEHKEFPYIKDSGCKMIANIVKSGKWNIFGIYKWTDLLRETFGDQKEIKHNWRGHGGYINASKWMIHHNKIYKNPPNPSSKYYTIINKYICNKEYGEFGIRKWSDMADVFLKREIERKRDLQHSIKQLIKYNKNKETFPKFLNFPIIHCKSINKYWESEKIHSWRSLMILAFPKSIK